ncbi:MAG: L,D-transpeptidase [Sporichthyaceae bacterium]
MLSRRIRKSVVAVTATALTGASLFAADLAAAADAHPAPAVHSARATPSACNVGRVVCIDKSARTVRFVVDGRTQISLAGRFGGPRTPSREGSFRIYWKNIDHVSSLFHTAMPFAMFYSGGQAVHYSADFARRGYNGASRGCVNTRDYAAMRALFHATRVGDRVYVYG